jgi:hypothetical protein
MTIRPVEMVVVLSSLAVGLAVLARGWSAARRTTLVTPWIWATAALVAWGATELAIAFSVILSSNTETSRFAAIVFSFCPMIAVLGAKRPQNAAWNFVVLSLWAIVALPAAENWFLHPGQKLSLGDARSWFLWILIVLGPVNYVPTRYWVAALVLAAAQVVALSRHLALIHRPMFGDTSPVALMLVTGALLTAWIVSHGEKAAAGDFDRVWLEFRDAFGLFWGLRLEERINAVAKQNGWDIELTWSGLRSLSGGESVAQIDPAIEAGLWAAMKGVLRRFGSNEWTDDGMK